jgi:MFS family permease
MGLGAAMTFPATLSLLSNVFTDRTERARAIGLWGAIAGVAIATGPIVGGWLLEHFTTPVHLYVPDISGIKRADRDPEPRP